MAHARPGRHRPRHPAGGVRVAAAARPDRRRRGARPLVQAAGGGALLGPRPGGLARPQREACWCCSARPRRRSRAGTTPSPVATGASPCPAGSAAPPGPRSGCSTSGRLPKSRGVPAALAPPLVAAIEARIARGEQSLVFLNRRGYAPVLHCGECSWKSGCPHCSAWRVFHKQDRTLRCHHCGLADAVPRACPDCGNPDIAPIGRGTERLEEQIGALPAGGADRPHRCRQHAQEGRARGPARRGPRRRGRRPGRHADDRQGPRLPAHRPGRRGQPRQLAVQQRLPRPRAPVRPADAGGRPGRPRRRRRPRRARCGSRPGTRRIRSTPRSASTTSPPSPRPS